MPMLNDIIITRSLLLERLGILEGLSMRLSNFLKPENGFFFFARLCREAGRGRKDFSRNVSHSQKDAK